MQSNTGIVAALFALSSLGLAPGASAQTAPETPPPPSRGATITNRIAFDLGWPTVASVPTLKYDQGDPTNDEQYMLEMINRARANPAEEGIRLVTTTDPYILSNYQYYQIDTAQLRAVFATYAPKPPLVFNARLMQAAHRHNNDMVANNFQSHVGTDKSLFDERITDAGYNGWTSLGENIFAYGQNLYHVLAGFLVDWGNPELGHRHNLLNFGPEDSLFTEIGVAVKTIPSPQPNHVGPLVVTHDLGNAGRRFVTGVVYDDRNGNGFYDQGEGIQNITIMPSNGAYYAITTASGGYSIPMPGVAGTVTFTATGTGLPVPISKELEITGPNIKVDFVPGGTTTTTAQRSPLNKAVVRPPQLRLVWTNGGPTADRYRWQVATDSGMAAVVARDTAPTDTSTTVPGLIEGETYYWRVAAHNTHGWGTWSTVWSFRLFEVPLKVQLGGPADGSTVKPGSARFWWHRSSGTTEHYRFQLATDAAMTYLVQTDSTLPDTSVMITGLVAEQDYYWRVEAGNAAGWSSASDVWRVRATTASAPAETTGERHVTVNAEPNPINGTTTFAFVLDRAAHVSVRICSSTGERVTELVNERMAAGTRTIAWETRGLPAGVYFYQLVVDDVPTAGRALVVVR